MGTVPVSADQRHAPEPMNSQDVAIETTRYFGGNRMETDMENRTSERPENPSARVSRETLGRAESNDDEAAEQTSDTRAVENESQLRLGGDTGFDRIIGPDEAGLGGGLDQAEEAQLGVTDEELAELARRARKPEK
jgi:hypothetical protein